jgi:hypothetical protein
VQGKLNHLGVLTEEIHSPLGQGAIGMLKTPGYWPLELENFVRAVLLVLANSPIALVSLYLKYSQYRMEDNTMSSLVILSWLSAKMPCGGAGCS